MQFSHLTHISNNCYSNIKMDNAFYKQTYLLLVHLNNFIVRSYRVVIVPTNIVTRRTNKAQIILKYKKHH